MDEHTPLTAIVKPNIDEPTLVVLAREMAWNIRDPLILLDAIGVTWAQFIAHIKTNAFYKRAYDTFLLEWESASTTNKRIAIKSAAALEDSLPHLGAKLVDAKESLPAKTETAKLFAKLAGAGEEKREFGTGEKFVITINLGADKIRLEETIGRGPETLEIQQFPEGAGTQKELQFIPESTTMSRKIQPEPQR